MQKSRAVLSSVKRNTRRIVLSNWACTVNCSSQPEESVESLILGAHQLQGHFRHLFNPIGERESQGWWKIIEQQKLYVRQSRQAGRLTST